MSTAGWFKSTRSSTNDNCVEVKFVRDSVQIRDSKYTGDPAARPIITVSPAEWTSFLGSTINDGQSVPAMTRSGDGFVTLSHNGVGLTYTPAEWDAFVAGVVAGEFVHEAVAA